MNECVAHRGPGATCTRSHRNAACSAACRKAGAGRIDREGTSAAAISRNVRRRSVRCAIVTDRRHAHSVTREDCPDGAAIGSAIQVLIGLKDAVARVQERRTIWRELHAVEHHAGLSLPRRAACADPKALRPRLRRHCEPGTRQRQRPRKNRARVGRNGVSRTANAVRVVGDVLANRAIVVDGDGPVVRPAFTHRA